MGGILDRQCEKDNSGTLRLEHNFVQRETQPDRSNNNL